jgi:UDP-sulfoquinovose synthase
MKIIVLGGDGFCGWPTSLHLSQDHDVLIVDNLSRRDIDEELGISSLTPIASITKRLDAWLRVSGRKINWRSINIAKEYYDLLRTLREFQPDAIVHFAEQRSAPFSMKSPSHKRYTVSNNVNGTNNLLAAIVEAEIDCHVVHLGTMGVYGYGMVEDLVIPEGYLEVTFATKSGEAVKHEILYPANPGSIYHMTKTQDQLLFAFYAKNDRLRVTDLHQGIVWGTQTDQTRRDPALINRFDYDGDYGTVLNRFIMQAAVGHPLTVHGTGGQTRAFIHIQDSVRCVELAIGSPPARGDRVRIMNQMTEVHRISDLARMVADQTGARIDHVDNPRNEAAGNSLIVTSESLPRLGLVPTLLETGLLRETTEIAAKYAARADLSKILCTSTWTKRRVAFWGWSWFRSDAAPSAPLSLLLWGTIARLPCWMISAPEPATRCMTSTGARSPAACAIPSRCVRPCAMSMRSCIWQR